MPFGKSTSTMNAFFQNYDGNHLEFFFSSVIYIQHSNECALLVVILYLYYVYAYIHKWNLVVSVSYLVSNGCSLSLFTLNIFCSSQKYRKYWNHQLDWMFFIIHKIQGKKRRQIHKQMKCDDILMFICLVTLTSKSDDNSHIEDVFFFFLLWICFFFFFFKMIDHKLWLNWSHKA